MDYSPRSFGPIFDKDRLNTYCFCKELKDCEIYVVSESDGEIRLLFDLINEDYQ